MFSYEFLESFKTANINISSGWLLLHAVLNTNTAMQTYLKNVPDVSDVFLCKRYISKGNLYICFCLKN